jgi:hypothetical protein
MIKSRRMKWAWHLAQNGEKKNVSRLLVGNMSLGRPRLRWMNNIKMDLEEVGWSGVYWIDLVHDRAQWRALVNTVMNHLIP